MVDLDLFLGQAGIDQLPEISRCASHIFTFSMVVDDHIFFIDPERHFVTDRGIGRSRVALIVYEGTGYR
jgi:hypothetical protein